MTETTENERRITVRPGMALATRNRPRGMWGQITTSVLRPGLFYRTLLPASETRQWLWAAILILALVGITTVRYSALTGTAGTDTGVVDPGMGEFPPDMGGGMVDPGRGGGVIDPGMGGDFGGIPPGGEVPVDTGTGGGEASTLTADLTTALLAASNIILGWLVLTVMLVVVPMLRGRAPKIGQNLQIAVWSSLPLAVMAVVQLIYYAGGGQLGQPGVQGLLAGFPQFDTLDSTSQALLISFTSRLTVFWLWTLLLVYFGARFALGGWRIVAFLIVIAWAGIQIVAPVVTGTITAPMAEELITDPGMGGDFGEFPPDMMGGEMPSGEFEVMPESTGEALPDMGGEMPDDMGGMPETESGEAEAPATEEGETGAFEPVVTEEPANTDDTRSGGKPGQSEPTAATTGD